jgi:hypothetical protein
VAVAGAKKRRLDLESDAAAEAAAPHNAHIETLGSVAAFRSGDYPDG